MDGRMYRQTESLNDRPTHVQMDVLIDVHANIQTDERADGQTDGCMNGQTNKWNKGQLERQTVRMKDSETDRGTD